MSESHKGGKMTQSEQKKDDLSRIIKYIQTKRVKKSYKHIDTLKLFTLYQLAGDETEQEKLSLSAIPKSEVMAMRSMLIDFHRADNNNTLRLKNSNKGKTR